MINENIYFLCIKRIDNNVSFFKAFCVRVLSEKHITFRKNSKRLMLLLNKFIRAINPFNKVIYRQNSTFFF